MKTIRDFTIENYRGYGKITVPAGTETNHVTASGIDENYNFVCEFGWVKTNYPEISTILMHDVTHYGINVPIEYVKLTLKFRGIDRFNRPIFKAIEGKGVYGSTDTLFSESAKAEEVIDHFSKLNQYQLHEQLTWFGNTFGCEPMGCPVKSEIDITILKEQTK